MATLHLLLQFPASPLLLLTLLLIPVYFLLANYQQKKLPPSPTKLPLIGNLHQLGTLPHRSLNVFSNKHGPLMLLRLGQVPFLVVSSPDMAREVLKTQDHIFANRPRMTLIKQILYDGRDIAFAPYGHYWRQVRKLTILHLLSSKMVQSFRHIREEEVALMIDQVARESALGPVNLSESLNSLAKGVITRVCLGKSSKEEGWYKVIQKLIEECSVMMGKFHIGDFIPRLGWLSTVTGLDAKAKEVFDEIDRILDKIMEDHIKISREDVGRNGGFIDVLLSVGEDLTIGLLFNKENIKAIVQDLIGAGTDSTYITMEWAMTEIVRNPRVMIKLQKELRQIAGSRSIINEEDLTDMKYLKAVLKESLRLHPPGPLLVPRESMEDTKIQGFHIPKKTRVVINVWAIGRDPNVWENPEEFVPERFIDSHLDFKGHDFQLTPFGAGRRICPGIQFGVTTVELVVANLVHQFDWKLPDGLKGEDLDMLETPGLTARKRINLRAVATHCFY